MLDTEEEKRGVYLVGDLIDQPGKCFIIIPTSEVIHSPYRPSKVSLTRINTHAATIGTNPSYNGIIFIHSGKGGSGEWTS